MDKEKLIYDFIDGELDSSKDPELFEMLAADDESRKAFKEQMFLKTSIRDDIHAYVPKPETSAKVFSSLGFSTAAVGSAKGGFWTSGKKLFATGAIASITTAVILFLLFPWGDGDTSIEKSNIPVTSSVESEIESESESNSNSLASTETVYIERKVNENTDLSEQNRELIKRNNELSYMVNTLREENKYLNNEVSKLQRKISNEDKIDTSISLDKDNRSSSMQRSFRNSIYNSNFIYSSPELNRNNGFVNLGLANSGVDTEKNYFNLEAGIGKYYQSIGEDFNERNNAFAENLNAGLYYNITNELSAGINVRQENFYQEFTENDDEGNLIVYQQQPKLYSGTFVFQYAPESIRLYGIRPKFELGIGASRVGELARLGAGIDYGLFGDAYLFIRADYTFLSFYHNNVNFSTNKFGSHLGIGYEF